MRYSEDQYQAFLEHLLSEIIEEHNRIGIAADQWKASFQLITPDFQKRKDDDKILLFPSDEKKRKIRQCFDHSKSRGGAANADTIKGCFRKLEASLGRSLSRICDPERRKTLLLRKNEKRSRGQNHILFEGGRTTKEKSQQKRKKLPYVRRVCRELDQVVQRTEFEAFFDQFHADHVGTGNQGFRRTAYFFHFFRRTANHASRDFGAAHAGIVLRNSSANFQKSRITANHQEKSMRSG